jgi:hypothetical protein
MQPSAAFALAGLTAVVLASALLRLRIYQDAYGWTELRFYVLVASLGFLNRPDAVLLFAFPLVQMLFQLLQLN